jgi:hypothetical protein
MPHGPVAKMALCDFVVDQELDVVISFIAGDGTEQAGYFSSATFKNLNEYVIRTAEQACDAMFWIIPSRPVLRSFPIPCRRVPLWLG